MDNIKFVAPNAIGNRMESLTGSAPVEFPGIPFQQVVVALVVKKFGKKRNV